MKKYNVKNYVLHKKDLEAVQTYKERFDNRDQLIIDYMPLVERICRKFSTSDQASGVLSINDLLQEGYKGLIEAVDKIQETRLADSTDPERTLEVFLSKRIKGSIRRAIDINRGDIRIPEHKLNEIRRDNGKDKKMVALFFNSIFLSIDNNFNADEEESSIFQIEDKSKPYNIDILNKYLLSLMKMHLDDREYEVLRLSYGLDCDKLSAKQIAEKLKITGSANYVRVSQIKRDALDKLIDNVEPDQVLDLLN
jgi:RNA polymerase sigma factor (sigma-70 family)